MKKITIALIVLLVAAWAASAAEISLRQIRDPVQFKDWLATNISDVSGVATNIAGASIVSGNIAVARVTNALASAGATIGGNIPVAALTNALAANLGTVDYTNVIVSADSKTNTIIVINGLVTSWVVTE